MSNPLNEYELLFLTPDRIMGKCEFTLGKAFAIPAQIILTTLPESRERRELMMELISLQRDFVVLAKIEDGITARALAEREAAQLTKIPKEQKH